MLNVLFAILVTGLVTYWLFAPESKPIKGVYREGGKWYYLKYVCFSLILKLRTWRKSTSDKSGETAGYGVKSKSSVEDMDKCQPLPDVKSYPMAVDAVYFCSSNKDGFYLVTATSRRQGGMVQILTYLRVPDVGLFQLPLHPETLHAETSPMSYSAAGLTIKVITPMKEWGISFDGELRNAETGKLHKVDFDLTWTGEGPYYDFDTDMNFPATCDSVSRETWTKEWFQELKLRHQTHYEQFGKTEGRFNIDGCGSYDVVLHGVRDHSYGNIREWRDLFRYGLQYVHLEDGTNVAIGVISMPKLLSRVLFGYVIHPQGQLTSVSSTDFELYEWGDDGNPPEEMQFNFCSNGKNYKLKCTQVCAPVFYMRDRCADGTWATAEHHDENSHGSIVHERMCKFEINGVSGTGISEWCYETNMFKYAVTTFVFLLGVTKCLPLAGLSKRADEKLNLAEFPILQGCLTPGKMCFPGFHCVTMEHDLAAKLAEKFKKNMPDPQAKTYNMCFPVITGVGY